MSRVLMIGLDGFELSLAESLMAKGLMPRLAALRDSSAVFDLDHGEAKYSGLAWEHVSIGRDPDEGARRSSLAFDTSTYEVHQPLAPFRPFAAELPFRTVVFDVPYFDLKRAPGTRGVTNWGAHDPGVDTLSVPEGLLGEMTERFGGYPAERWIYGFTWPSAERTKAAGEALEAAVQKRAAAAKWLLLAEHIRDWDLGMVVVSEAHSAIEPLWHGVDPTHPLHEIESAAPAGESLRRIYVAIDTLIGELADAIPDATLMVFAMHGMGPNRSDLPSMVLIPELLYRYAFGRPYLRQRAWRTLPNGVPALEENDGWTETMRRLVPKEGKWKRRARHIFGLEKPPVGEPSWMPTAWYSPFWSKMPAFALPSFYDAQVRINLKGREAQGRVAPSDYRSVLNEIADTIGESRDLLTGGVAIESIKVTDKDPLEVGRFDADIYVRFNTHPVGLKHPRYGEIGPFPYRRTGGHTGEKGFLYLKGANARPGDYGMTSAFDVLPTAIDLLGQSYEGFSGRSLAPQVLAPKKQAASS